jgi:hypothetical protein
MGGAHPGLDRPKWMLDRATAERHGIGVKAEPLPGDIDQMSVFPPGDPPLRAGRAFAVEGAGLAFVDPVSPDLKAAFLAHGAMGQRVSGGTDIDSRSTS